MKICYLLQLIVKAAGEIPSKRSKKKSGLWKNNKSLKIPRFFRSILYAIVWTFLLYFYTFGEPRSQKGL